MPATKWSDDGFLDGLREQGDSLADNAVQRLIRERDVSEVNRLFQIMRSDNQPLPADLPPSILDFLERTKALPAGVDLERVERGEAVFMRHAFTGPWSSWPRAFRRAMATLHRLAPGSGV